MTTTKEVTQEATRPVPIVPEVLTEEHHEAIRASWEMPVYEKPVPAAPTSHKALYAGLIAGGVCLALGAGVGYWVGTQQATETVVREPYVVTKLLTPSVTDANGLNMGRRLAPIETQAPTALGIRGPVDANGLTMGRRLAPIETQAPTALPVRLVDANGLTMGRRIAPIDTQAPTAVSVPGPVDANGMPLGRRVAPIETQTPKEIPGYSVTHDSRIIEPVQTISFGRWTRPATF